MPLCRVYTLLLVVNSDRLCLDKTSSMFATNNQCNVYDYCRKGSNFTAAINIRALATTTYRQAPRGK